MNLLITGDSHAVVLGKSLAEITDQERQLIGGEIRAAKLLSFPVALRKFFDVDGSRLKFVTEQIRPDKPIAFGLSGIDLVDKNQIIAISMPFTTTVLLRNPIWKIYAPWQHAGAHRHSFSCSVMKEIVLGHFQHVIDLFSTLKRFGVPSIAIDAPAPRRVVTSAWSKNDDTQLIISIDQVSRRIMNEQLSLLGIPVVPTPKQTIDDHGFLRDEFAADAHHGNQFYGALMLRKVLKEASTIDSGKVS
jgi:hypothetical protein